MKLFNRRNAALLVLAAIFLGSCSGYGVAYVTSPQTQADICANKYFPDYSSLISDEWSFFGFPSQESARNAYLGAPLEVYCLDNSQFDPEISIQKQMRQSALYRYPVMSGGEALCDFSIVLENGQWHPIDIGGNRTKIAMQAAQEHGFDIKECRELSLGDSVFIFTIKDGEEYAIPIRDIRFYSDLETDWKSNEPLSGKDLRDKLARYARYYTDAYNYQLQHRTYTNGLPDQIGCIPGPIPLIPMEQDSILNRLENWFNYII